MDQQAEIQRLTNLNTTLNKLVVEQDLVIKSLTQHNVIPKPKYGLVLSKNLEYEYDSVVLGIIQVSVEEEDLKKLMPELQNKLDKFAEDDVFYTLDIVEIGITRIIKQDELYIG